MPSKVDQIKEIKELLDAGALTQKEFDAQKKEILDGGAVGTNDVKVTVGTPVEMAPTPPPVVKPLLCVLPAASQPSLLVLF